MRNQAGKTNIFVDLINNYGGVQGGGGGRKQKRGTMPKKPASFKGPGSDKRGWTQTAGQMLSMIPQLSTNPMT